MSRLDVKLAHIEESNDLECMHSRSNLLPSMNLSVVPMKNSKGGINLPSQARLFIPAVLLPWRATWAFLSRLCSCSCLADTRNVQARTAWELPADVLDDMHIRNSLNTLGGVVCPPKSSRPSSARPAHPTFGAPATGSTIHGTGFSHQFRIEIEPTPPPFLQAEASCQPPLDCMLLSRKFCSLFFVSILIVSWTRS